MEYIRKGALVILDKDVVANKVPSERSARSLRKGKIGLLLEDVISTEAEKNDLTWRRWNCSAAQKAMVLIGTEIFLIYVVFLSELRHD